MAGFVKSEIRKEKLHISFGKIKVNQQESQLLFQKKIDTLHSLYQNKVDFDLEIIVSDEQNKTVRLPLHKIVLAAHVDKLDPNIKSDIDLTKGEIRLNASLTSKVIEFLYTREIFISETNVESLLKIASALKLITLRECCISFLKNPAAHNVIQFMIWANTYNLSELFELLLNCAIKHLPFVLQCPEVQFLDADTLCVLLGFYYFPELISKNIATEDAHSVGEVIPLIAVAQWLGHNSNAEKLQKEQKLKLIKLLKLQNISLQDLMKVLQNHKGVLAIDDCKKVLFKDIKKKLFGSTKNWQGSKTSQDEVLFDTKSSDNEAFLCAIMSHHLAASKPEQIWAPKIIKGKRKGFLEVNWNFLYTGENNKLPVMRITYCAVVILNNRLYLMGGIEPYAEGLEPSHPTNQVCCYDLLLSQWFTLAPMMEKRHNFAVATINGLICVIGGQGEGISCESYIPAEDRWVYLTTLSQGKVGIGATAFKRYIMIAGGFAYMNGNKKALKFVERYDLSEHRWLRLNSLPGKGFAFCSMTQLNGKVYLIGGAEIGEMHDTLQSLNSILEYRDVDDTWTSISLLKCARHCAGVAVLGNKIYIVGGISNDKTENSVECFHCETHQTAILTEVLPMPVIGSDSCATYENEQ